MFGEITLPFPIFPFPRMHPATALPSLPALPDHQEHPLVTASTVHKSLCLQQRRRQTPTTSDNTTAARIRTESKQRFFTDATAMKTLTVVTSHTPKTCHVGTLPNVTHTLIAHCIDCWKKTYCHMRIKEITQTHRAMHQLSWTVPF